MRLEAHTKQLSKELRSARAALEQERKLRKVQSDTIKVRKIEEKEIRKSNFLSQMNLIFSTMHETFSLQKLKLMLSIPKKPSVLQVLWKKIQSLQMENELDYNSFDNLNRQHFSEMGRGYSGDVQRATLSKNMRVTERKLSRLLAGASMYEDSDSSRGITCTI